MCTSNSMWEPKIPFWEWQFPFWDKSDHFRRGGGKAKCLKKIYIPRAIFNIPGPPCSSVFANAQTPFALARTWILNWIFYLLCLLEKAPWSSPLCHVNSHLSGLVKQMWGSRWSATHFLSSFWYSWYNSPLPRDRRKSFEVTLPKQVVTLPLSNVCHFWRSIPW